MRHILHEDGARAEAFVAGNHALGVVVWSPVTVLDISHICLIVRVQRNQRHHAVRGAEIFPACGIGEDIA